MLGTKPWPIKTPVVTARRCQGAEKYRRRCKKGLQGPLIVRIAEDVIELVNGFAGWFAPCRNKTVNPFSKDSAGHLYNQLGRPLSSLAGSAHSVAAPQALPARHKRPSHGTSLLLVGRVSAPEKHPQPIRKAADHPSSKNYKVISQAPETKNHGETNPTT